MPRRQHHPLAAFDGDREPVADRLARAENAYRINGNRTAANAFFRFEPRRGRHELEHLRLRERPQARHAELLVGVAGDQKMDVAEHVVERMTDLPARDAAVEQPVDELVMVDGARRPTVVDSRQARGVSFDDVHLTSMVRK